MSGTRKTFFLRLTLALLVLLSPLGLYLFWCWFYYGERDDIISYYGHNKGVSHVEVLGHDETGSYQVNGVTLQLQGRPDAVISLELPDENSDGDGHIVLSQLGPWMFRVLNFGTINHTSAATGAPMPRKDYTWSFAVDIGPSGEWAAKLPFPIRNAQDLVAHYDDLLRIFATWPHADNIGKPTYASGDNIQYYCYQNSNDPWPPAWLEEADKP